MPFRGSSRRRATSPPGGRKTRITIYLDDDVLAWFREEVRSSRGSYQRAINLALRDHMAREPLEASLRRVVREELAGALGRSPASAYSYGPGMLVADAEADGGYGASRARDIPKRRRSQPRR